MSAIYENGKLTITATSGELTGSSLSIWTKGMIINREVKTASKCVVKEINGTTYRMFYEWKSGDYVFRGMAPYYFVFKTIQ